MNEIELEVAVGYFSLIRLLSQIESFSASDSTHLTVFKETFFAQKVIIGSISSSSSQGLRNPMNVLGNENVFEKTRKDRL